MKTKQVIEVSVWDAIVQETYGRPYSFQQQDGCQSRGAVPFTVPKEAIDYENDTLPEKVNGEQRGVSFAAWLARDPKAPVAGRTDYSIGLWWHRNFYPEFQMVANDLHAKGLLEAGEHTILIDW